MPTPTSRLTALSLTGFLVALLFGSSACILDTTGKGPPLGGDCDTHAGFKFQLTDDGPSSAAGAPYQTEITWHAELLTADANVTCGNTGPVDFTQTYAGSRDPSGNYTEDFEAIKQQPGLWRFTVTADSDQPLTCDETITSGNIKLIPFTRGQPGCTP